MLVVGLVGGIASGKSFVAGCFQALGAAVIDADRIGHEVLLLPRVIESVKSKWPEVMTSDLTIDRKKLAAIVFAPQCGELNLNDLESILHPEIELRMQELISKFQDAGTQVVIIDAPVLIKAGWHHRCKRILFVDSPLALRVNRALERGWDRSDLIRREARQTSLEAKRLMATDVVENHLSAQHTRDQVLKIWNSWLKMGLIEDLQS